MPAQHTSSALPNQSIAQAQLRSLYENPDYAIFTVDPSGLITTWNRGAERMKHYTAQEVVGHHFSMLYPQDARLRGEPMEHLALAKRNGRYRAQGLRMRKGGETFLADVFISPMYRDSEIIGFSKVVADISDKGRLQEERNELRAQVKELELQQKLREKFVSMMSHDLRNPLAAVKAAQELFLKSPCSNEGHKKLASISFSGIVRADQMITDLLDANRITAGEQIPLHLEQCELRELLRTVCNELKLVHGDRFVMDDQGPVYGYWDPSTLKRVIENLATNAIKYGDARASVKLKVSQARDRAILEVHNQGPAIPPEEQRSLFTQYRRSRSAKASGKRGWGLGLILVRGIVEAHCGSVRVESSPDRGTTFVIDLPKDRRMIDCKEAS